MPRVIFVQPSGTETVIDAPSGTSVMRAAVSNAVPGVIGECGGDMVCATCHVYVDEAWFGTVGPPSDDEADMLEVTSEEPTACSRLSCQIRVTEALDGLTVTVPASQR
jgi:2Fe-2S ferredoxin